MTERRLNKLLMELDIPSTEVYIPDNDKILKGVMSKIDVKEKRTVNFTFMRVISIAAIIATIMALTTVAFGKDGVWKQIFTFFEAPTEVEEELVTEEVEEDNNTSVYITEEETEATEVVTEEVVVAVENVAPEEEEEEVILPVVKSIEDDNYILQLNEISGNSKNVYITVTVKAKTDEARITDGTYRRLITEAYSDEDGWVEVNGEIEEIEDNRRKKSRSYELYVSAADLAKENSLKMRITFGAFSIDMEGEKYILFEMESGEEKIDFELSGQPFDGGRIVITPTSIEITAPREATEEYAPDARNLNTFFKFRNGSIRTFNQLAASGGDVSYVGGDAKLYKCSVRTKYTVDIYSIESVIIKGVEYPVNNPDNYKSANIPANLKPFVVNGGGKRSNEFYYVCSINQLNPCIDITYSEYGAAEFYYGGKTYRVEADNLVVMVNGSNEHILSLAPFADESGELWVGQDFLKSLLGIRYGEIGQTGTYLIVP